MVPARWVADKSSPIGATVSVAAWTGAANAITQNMKAKAILAFAEVVPSTRVIMVTNSTIDMDRAMIPKDRLNAFAAKRC